MTRVHTAIIHGIGVTKPGYSKPLIAGLTEAFDRRLKVLLDSRNDFTDQIRCHEILWDDVISENQRQLAVILRKGFGLAPEEDRTGLLMKILLFPKRTINWLRTDFAAESIQDILAYRHPEAYRKIHQKVLSCIESIPVRGNQAHSLSLITHSLGTVVGSDFVWDRQKKHGRFHKSWMLGNFFTMGSPLALFVLQFGLEPFKFPIRLEDPDGRWINIYDRDDPIAYPLKPLNQAYDRVVLKDHAVNTGLFGIAHTRYWKHRPTQQIIARKLALDWLQLNNKLDAVRLKGLYNVYDEILGL